jgi:hypothetical protein
MINEVGGKYFMEPSRKVPIAREVDVVVVGGGMAGVCAAIAAGRMGLRTLLVEYFGYLGGNATNGSIDTFCGFFTFGRKEVQFVKGIGGEIVQTLVERGSAQVEELGVVAFDPEMVKIVLDEKIVEAKVEPLFYTQMVAPIVEKDIIKGVIVENKRGRQAILAKIVLDCTGDGDVCAFANVPFELGDGKGGFEACDMCFRVANVGPNFTHNVEKFAALIDEALPSGKYKLTRTGFCILGYTMIPGVWWANMARIPWVVNGTDPEHLTRATIEGRKIVREFSRFMTDKLPGFEHSEVIQTGEKLGIRETRRVMGEHVLTEDEILTAKKFDDGIGASAWPVEVHTAEGKSKFEFLKGDDFHTIPYRSLIPIKVENLLMAGRFISCTHFAQAAIRVMGPASVMGQAIGTAAVLSIKEGVLPRKLDVKLLQRELAGAGVFLG